MKISFYERPSEIPDCTQLLAHPELSLALDIANEVPHMARKAIMAMAQKALREKIRHELYGEIREAAQALFTELKHQIFSGDYRNLEELFAPLLNAGHELTDEPMTKDFDSSTAEIIKGPETPQEIRGKQAAQFQYPNETDESKGVE